MHSLPFPYLISFAETLWFLFRSISFLTKKLMASLECWKRFGYGDKVKVSFNKLWALCGQDSIWSRDKTSKYSIID